MASVAILKAGLLSRKGGARPTITQGLENRGSGRGSPRRHSTAMRVVRLTPAEGSARSPRVRGDKERSNERVRATVRLRRDLHRRFKIFCAVTERTQQSVLVRALDDYLVRQNGRGEHAGDRRWPAPD